MSHVGHVSAVSVPSSSRVGCRVGSADVNALSFGASYSMGSKLRLPTRNSVMTKLGREYRPLKVCFELYRMLLILNP